MGFPRRKLLTGCSPLSGPCYWKIKLVNDAKNPRTLLRLQRLLFEEYTLMGSPLSVLIFLISRIPAKSTGCGFIEVIKHLNKF